MNGFEKLTGWKFPIPPHSEPIVAIKRNGQEMSPCCERQGKIGISDTSLVGVLAALDIDPITDEPIVCGDRGWWWFDDPEGKIRKMVVAYYGTWNGDTGSLAFVRKCAEMTSGFAKQAKQSVIESRTRWSKETRLA